MKTVSVIIPLYNEQDSLIELYSQIQKSVSVYDYEIIFKSVLSNHDPLAPIKSVRNGNFIINVNPSNKVLIGFMKRMGMEHIQSSFLIKSIIN